MGLFQTRVLYSVPISSYLYVGLYDYVKNVWTGKAILFLIHYQYILLNLSTLCLKTKQKIGLLTSRNIMMIFKNIWIQNYCFKVLDKLARAKKLYAYATFEKFNKYFCIPFHAHITHCSVQFLSGCNSHLTLFTPKCIHMTYTISSFLTHLL